ncbi:hypothetical protein B0H14DRAFT_2633592 [Mycena olivaceomarginata]|nr:hypothetical protein B0H14DRAFT_2633592 [Mycena olivaceomarginata]
MSRASRLVLGHLKRPLKGFSELRLALIFGSLTLRVHMRSNKQARACRWLNEVVKRSEPSTQSSALTLSTGIPANERDRYQAIAAASAVAPWPAALPTTSYPECDASRSVGGAREDIQEPWVGASIGPCAVPTGGFASPACESLFAKKARVEQLNLHSYFAPESHSARLWQQNEFWRWLSKYVPRRHSGELVQLAGLAPGSCQLENIFLMRPHTASDKHEGFHASFSL